jgi:hypothetical protein
VTVLLTLACVALFVLLVPVLAWIVAQLVWWPESPGRVIPGWTVSPWRRPGVDRFLEDVRIRTRAQVVADVVADGPEGEEVLLEGGSVEEARRLHRELTGEEWSRPRWLRSVARRRTAA